MIRCYVWAQVQEVDRFTGEERMREPCSSDTRLQHDGSESLLSPVSTAIHVGSPKQASVEVWGVAI